jgi:hypothetical protein
LPILLAAVREALGNGNGDDGGLGARAQLAALIPAGDPYLKTGEMLIAHTVRAGRLSGRVVAVERHRPEV